MASSSTNRGVPPLSPTLIRPTPPDPEPAPAEVEGDDAGGNEAADGQGRGANDARPAARSRRRRVDRPAEKLGKRGLYLSASVWQRLQLEAIRKGTTVSAVAGDLLERNLPRLRIERDA